jgi:hypothetical protein
MEQRDLLDHRRRDRLNTKLIHRGCVPADYLYFVYGEPGLLLWEYGLLLRVRVRIQARIREGQ